jgi:peptide/nickel transport system substrate-binding protein
VNDARVLQAVGAMLSRIGVETRVEAMPRATYFGRAQPPRMEFSLSLMGWGSAGEGESGYGLSALLHSRQPERGLGGINNGGYANPAFDALCREALSRFDGARAPRRPAARDAHRDGRFGRYPAFRAALRDRRPPWHQLCRARR